MFAQMSLAHTNVSAQFPNWFNYYYHFNKLIYIYSQKHFHIQGQQWRNFFWINLLCTKLKKFVPDPSGVLWYPKDYFLKRRILILFYIEICVYLYLNCYCMYKHRIFGILGHFNDNVGHFWKTSASPHVRTPTDTTTSTTTLRSPASPKLCTRGVYFAKFYNQLHMHIEL